MVSGYTDSQITAILSGVNHLKGLVGRLLATSASSLPTVDFAVDMFDRGNQGVLDGYWQDTTGSWTLRSNKVICQSNSTDGATAETRLESVSDQAVPWTSNLGDIGFTTSYVASTLTPHQQLLSRADNMYAAKFSSRDLNIELTFDVPTGYTVPRITTSVLQNGVFTSILNTDATKVPLSNCGATFGNVGGRSLGTTLLAGIRPAYTEPGGTASTNASVYFMGGIGPNTLVIPPELFPEQKVTVGEFGSKDFSRTSFAGSMQTGFAGNTIENYSPTIATGGVGGGTRIITEWVTYGSPMPIVAGTNVLLMTAVGNVYTVTLNGVLLYTTTAELMIDRTYCGITAFPYNTLSPILTNALAYYGITRFRAWVSGGADPGFQTGRGTYASGYNDKYHIYSSSGSVTYNPLA